MNNPFWEMLDEIIKSSEMVIDRPGGSYHPRYPDMQYPLDYGYLRNTSGGDGNEIDVWIGSKPEKTLDCIIATADNVKNDVEIKLLIGCTEDEKNIIFAFHNNSKFMKALRIDRLPN